MKKVFDNGDELRLDTEKYLGHDLYVLRFLENRDDGGYNAVNTEYFAADCESAAQLAFSERLNSPTRPSKIGFDNANHIVPKDGIWPMIMPPAKGVPSKFYSKDNPWNIITSAWFYEGVNCETIQRFELKTELAPDKIVTNVSRWFKVLNSRNWEHNYKIAGCALLLSRLFTIVYDPTIAEAETRKALRERDEAARLAAMTPQERTEHEAFKAAWEARKRQKKA